MAKLIQFWQSRNKVTRVAFIWTIVLQVVHIIFWYIGQNVNFGSIDSARPVQTANMVCLYIEFAMILILIIGIIMQMFGKLTLGKDQSVKVADGIWMVKK